MVEFHKWYNWIFFILVKDRNCSSGNRLWSPKCTFLAKFKFSLGVLCLSSVHLGKKYSESSGKLLKPENTAVNCLHIEARMDSWKKIKSIRLLFIHLEKYEGDFKCPWSLTFMYINFPIKKQILSLYADILKKAAHKLTTVKYLLVERMKVSGQYFNGCMIFH